MAGRILLAALLITAAAILAGCEAGRTSTTEHQKPDRTKVAPRVDQGFTDSGRTSPSTASVNAKNLSQLEQNSVCATQSIATLRNERSLIGNFTPPDDVPEYEARELAKGEEKTGRSTLKVAKLMVDTPTGDVSAYTFITEDIKATYADYDAVTVEFTDLSTGMLPYNGGALIFNTACGALYVGYVYGPPERGYIVEAGKSPSLYPSHR